MVLEKLYATIILPDEVNKVYILQSPKRFQTKRRKTMNPKNIYLLIVFALLSMPLASATESIYTSRYNDIRVNVASTTQISADKLDFFRTSLNFIPRQDVKQDLLSVNTTPDALIGENAVFLWTDPNQREFNAYLTADVRVKNEPITVSQKISFPLNIKDPELDRYLGPSMYINSDDSRISKLASNISAGETDEYVVVFRLAQWVENNIKYDLNTLTADAVQNATWTLENKEGVCDELTILFISMSRSVGIPARYVSGIAYTNYQDANTFGPHAWAEVYFPDYGWVPVDVTYREFGYIDATHVKFSDSADANEPSIDFTWKGSNVVAQTESPNITAKFIGSFGTAKDIVYIKTSALRKEENIGSYNVIAADITNLNDYYLPIRIQLAQTQSLNIEGSLNRNILLKPNERKTTYWLVSVDDTLSDKYIYTFPVTIFVENMNSSDIFSVSREFPNYSKQDMIDSVSALYEQEIKNYVTVANLTCQADATYVNESAKISCSLRNVGNSYLEGLSVCLEDSCKNISLGIMQKANLSFEKTFARPGEFTLLVSAKNQNIQRDSYFDVLVKDKPDVILTNISCPTTAGYNEVLPISFIVSKISVADALNTEIIVNTNSAKTTVQMPGISNDIPVNFTIKANELNANYNNITFSLNYNDENNNTYTKQYLCSINLEKASLWDRIIIFFRNIGKAFS